MHERVAIAWRCLPRQVQLITAAATDLFTSGDNRIDSRRRRVRSDGAAGAKRERKIAFFFIILFYFC